MLYLVQLVIAGIAGTGLMTLYVFLSSQYSAEQIRVVNILGRMLAGFTANSILPTSYKHRSIIGLLVHYSIGVFFSCIIGWMWYRQIIFPGLKYALITGAVIGVLAVIVWSLFIKIHPHPPKLSLPAFLFFIYTGHFFF